MKVQVPKCPFNFRLYFNNEESMVSNLQYKPGLGKSDHLVLEFTYNCYIGSSDPQPRN